MKVHNLGVLLLLCVGLCRVAVLADSVPGNVVGWGDNVSGEATGVPASDWGFPYATGLVVVAGQTLHDVKAISAGTGHGLALSSQGVVFGWGANLSGEVAGFKTDYEHSATNGQVRIAGRILSNVIGICAGNGFSLAATSEGSVAVWGEGRAGQGFGQTEVPLGLTNVVAVACGFSYSMALRMDRTVAGWGARKTPLGLSNIVALAVSKGPYGLAVVLCNDGSVLEWGVDGVAERAPAGATNVTSIAAGEGHYLALRRDGTVFGWGSNQFGEATGVPSSDFQHDSSGVVALAGRTLRDVIAVAAGNDYSLALRRDGTVAAWGNNGFHATDVPAGLKGVVAIAAGDNYCLAITTNSSSLAIKR